MRAIMSVILTIVLSVASATAGIRHYCDTILATSTNDSRYIFQGKFWILKRGYYLCI